MCQLSAWHIVNDLKMLTTVTFLWLALGPPSPVIVLCTVLSHVQLFASPWTIAHQAPLSMKFSTQETGLGCHFLLQGIFPTQGSYPCLLHLLCWLGSLNNCLIKCSVIRIFFLGFLRLMKCTELLTLFHWNALKSEIVL